MNPRHILPFLALLAIGGLPAMAAETAKPRGSAPGFALPLACNPGVDCWVMNYVDRGPLEDGKATDPFCGQRTYDKNKGTVFALRDIPQMEQGVNVVAARDGIVKKVRSGEPDRLPSKNDLNEIRDAQKECGNAVLIDHGKDLHSVYCHLKQNSITVKPGDKVKAGHSIGQVGLSGYTSFPQLHFGITSKGAVIDPFTGHAQADACGDIKNRLWDSSVTLNYEPVEFYNAGFSGLVPTMRDADTGHARQSSIPATSSVMAFWTVIFGAEKGDKITLDITGPDGTVISSRAITQKNTHTRQLYYTGRKIAEGKLPAGVYTGKATLARKMKDGSMKEIKIERTVNVQG